MSLRWDVPWHQLADPGPTETELRRELPAGHVLLDVPIRALGYRQDRDDVAVALLDGSHRFAIVHLTYRQETDPRWPNTEILDSAKALQSRVNTDQEDFAD
jgi:hypothetical protein